MKKATINKINHIDTDERIVIHNKFGQFEVSREQQLLIPAGLIGFPWQHSYCILPAPHKKLLKFKLLQNIEDSKIVFLVLELAKLNSILHLSDIQPIAELIHISLDNLKILLVVAHKVLCDSKFHLTVNAKAPIFIDQSTNIGMQYVIQGANYSTQHILL